MSKNRLIETYGIEKIKHGLHLLLYGAGGKKTLELVARYADAWDYGLCPYEEFLDKISILKNYCDSIGRNYEEITKAWQRSYAS